MKYIMYRGANQVSKVSNELAGCFSYYAKAEDALRLHKFVEKMVGTYREPVDYLGNRFEVYREPMEDLHKEEPVVEKSIKDKLIPICNGTTIKLVLVRVVLGYKDDTVGVTAIALNVLDKVTYGGHLTKAAVKKVTAMVTKYMLSTKPLVKDVNVVDIHLQRQSESSFEVITL